MFSISEGDTKFPSRKITSERTLFWNLHPKYTIFNQIFNFKRDWGLVGASWGDGVGLRESESEFFGSEIS